MITPLAQGHGEIATGTYERMIGVFRKSRQLVSWHGLHWKPQQPVVDVTTVEVCHLELDFLGTLTTHGTAWIGSDVIKRPLELVVEIIRPPPLRFGSKHQVANHTHNMTSVFIAAERGCLPSSNCLKTNRTDDLVVHLATTNGPSIKKKAIKFGIFWIWPISILYLD
jgi:hypothetical protein